MDIKKFKSTFLFFSNSIEMLFDFLKTNLFALDQDIFQKRFLIVPSREMEKWIALRLANQIGISSGIKTLFLGKAVHSFCRDFFSAKQPFFFPDQLELMLKLEELLSEFKELQDPFFAPVLKYLRGNEKRMMPLAKTLSVLFQKYGVYGKNHCSDWEKSPQDWQQMLWKKVYEKWDYPLKVIPSLELKENVSPVSIHLFSFSHLSPLHFYFFQKLSEHHRIFFYQLSPCKEFWSDLSKKEYGDSLFEEGRSLLTNLGKVGRETAKVIEEADDLVVYENYQNPTPSTALKKLQENILLLKTSQLTEDDSIQIHSSSTPYREVQNLQHTLYGLMQKKGFEPKDCLVMAPDISVYEPYISSLFDAYQIADMPSKNHNSQVKGLFLLLELDVKRWSANSILQLFGHPLFKKKRRWNEEDVFLLQDWIKKTGVRWALHNEQRDIFLKHSHCQKPMEETAATWQEGINLLLEDLALGEEGLIGFTESELLGEYGEVLNSLYVDLQELKKEKTLCQWTEYLKGISQKYFAETDDQNFLFEELNKFAKAGTFFEKRKYPFQKMEFFLKEYLGKEKVTIHPNQLQAVTFCSMLPMRAIPAKVIAILGMNDGVFPRKDSFFALDLLRKAKGDFSPSKSDFDRYLFLEAILSAREVLLISYLAGKEPPSPLVSEVLRYVPQKEICHPCKSYDATYFDKTNPFLENYSYHDYNLASRFFERPLITPSFFSRKREEGLPKGEVVVDISEIMRLIRNPLKHYFSHTYGSAYREEEEIEDEESFTLSPLQKNLFRKFSFRENLPDLLSKASLKKDFPLGVFGKLAQNQIGTEIREIKNHMGSFSWQSVELVLHQKSCFFDEEGIWRIPPLRITLSDDLTAIIVGKIEGIYEEGLLVLNQSNFVTISKIWPLFIIATSLTLPKGFEMKNIFFAKEGSIKKRFHDQSDLNFLLKYYFISQKNPSPLFPEWLEFFLKKDAAALRKNALSNDYSDPILKWALLGRSMPNFDELITDWGGFAERIYKEMYDAWF